VVSNDSRHANEMLDKIGSFVSGLTEAVVLDRSLELVHVDPERALGTRLGRGASDDDDWGRS
jgi:hypothetical protein